MPLIGLGKIKAELNTNIESRLNKKVRAVYFSGLTAIIKGTPVGEGYHRNAWLLSVGRPSSKKTTSKSKSGSNSFSELASMPSTVLGSAIYFTNYAPAIHTLEYGGFPKPVKKGTYDKKSKTYKKLSAGGFSKQAPKGWVRAAMILMKNKVNK